MRCLRCNYENNDNVKFCANCGSKIEETNNSETNNNFQQPDNINQTANNYQTFETNMYQQPTNNTNQNIIFQQPTNNFQQPMNNFNNFNQPKKKKTGLIIGICIGIVSIIAIVVLLIILLGNDSNKLVCSVDLAEIESSFEEFGKGTMSFEAKVDKENMVHDITLKLNLKVDETNYIEHVKESFDDFCDYEGAEYDDCEVTVKSNVVEINAHTHDDIGITKEDFIDETKYFDMTCK